MNRDSQHCQSRWASRIVLFFVLATCVRQWTGPFHLDSHVSAQLPDPARQRLDLVHEARRSNELLADIKELLVIQGKVLETHTFNVRVRGADNQAPPLALPPGGGL